MNKVVAAIVALALMASQAHALMTLQQGDVTIHLRDATTLYTDSDQNPSTPKLPRLAVQDPPTAGFASAAPAIGDENRSVIHVDQFVYTNAPTIVPDVGELTGVAYGLTLVNAVAGSTPGSLDLFFTGGRIQLYLDPTPEASNGLLSTFDPAGDGKAPALWVEPNQFPNVNLGDDSVLWLDTEFVPIYDGLPYTVVTHLNQLTGTGGCDGGYLKILGGSGANLFETGGFIPPSGIAADLSLAYSLQGYPHSGYVGSAADLGGWQFRSEDPMLASIIPEPATITLLGLGLTGIMAARRRSRK